MRFHFLCLIVCAGLTAQQPASDPVIRLDVRQVLVPVIVTDQKGHHASGLRASDFRIFEDGTPQEIAAFSTGTAGPVDDLGALSTRAADAGAPRRTYVICIDTLHASAASAVRVREALEQLFRDEKGTDAQYVLIGIGRQLQVLQTATTNPQAVLGKIRAAGFQAAIGGADAAALAAQLNSLNTRMEEFCRRCACGGRASQRTCDSEIDNLKQSVDGEAERWKPLGSGLAAQFKSVVEELAKLPTGRTLVLVSGGFNLNPVEEFYAAVAAWLPASPQFRVARGKDLDPRIQDALQIAAARNVIIYGIDSRGGSAPALSTSGPMDASGPGGGRETQSVIRSTTPPLRSTALQTAPGQSSKVAAAASSATMEQLASATGGVYFHDGKDLLKQFRGALADGREYYMLAYVSKNGAADGSFRRITVQVAGKNLNVRAKAGYWAARSDQ